MIMPWPVPTPPERGELLSSWLVRAAFRQGCDPSVLTDDLWPTWRCWTRDVDCDLDRARLERLERRSGIASERIRLSSLVPVAKQITGGTPAKKGALPWITTLGSRGCRRRGGLQFCPQCLEEDERPYYRRCWRFSWHTACEHHGTALQDRCPHCDLPVTAHRLSVRETLHIARCGHCGTDLRNGADTVAADPDALALQEAADSMLREDAGIAANANISVPDWFVVVRFHAALVRRAALKENATLGRALSALGVPPVEVQRIDHGMGIDSLRQNVRAEMFAGAWRLLSLDAESFVAALLDAGVTRQSFCGDQSTMPAPLATIREALPDNPRTRRRPKRRSDRPRTQREVNAMAARLERRLAMRTR